MQLFVYVYFNFVVNTLLVDLGIASYAILNEGGEIIMCWMLAKQQTCFLFT